MLTNLLATASLLCGTGSMQVACVCPSVCLSIPFGSKPTARQYSRYRSKAWAAQPGGVRGTLSPLLFGTRGYNENDLPVLLQNLFTYWQTT